MAVFVRKTNLPTPEYSLHNVRMPESDRGGSADVHANGHHVGYAQFQDGNMHASVHFEAPKHKQDWERSKKNHDHDDGAHLYHHMSDEDKTAWHNRQAGIEQHHRNLLHASLKGEKEEKEFKDDDLDSVHAFKKTLKESIITQYQKEAVEKLRSFYNF